jgi:alpha-ketoglutarate-dependent taurine dioxygenase
MNQEKTLHNTLPFIWNNEEMSAESFINYYRANEVAIAQELTIHGSIKFKGIEIPSMETFQYIVDSVSEKFLNYIDGNSPRTKLSGHVYTSTEYDQTQKITMHNELSYSAKWPNKLFFSCLVPSETGGETLLADSRSILNAMDRAIVEEVRARGVMYVRNLHGGMGMGPSWQDTFETNDKSQLESYLKDYNIDFQWMGNENLRLRQHSKGIIRHRATGEELWFNQIDQFHPIHLGEEMHEAMYAMYESPEEFPMYVKYGDGTEISSETIEKILSAIEKVTVAPKWDTNEFLLVDNEMVAHGRNPYTGNRRVLVAMSE